MMGAQVAPSDDHVKVLTSLLELVSNPEENKARLAAILEKTADHNKAAAAAQKALSDLRSEIDKHDAAVAQFSLLMSQHNTQHAQRMAEADALKQQAVSTLSNVQAMEQKLKSKLAKVQSILEEH